MSACPALSARRYPNLPAISSCVIDGQSRMAWATRRSNSRRFAWSCFLSSSFSIFALFNLVYEQLRLTASLVATSNRSKQCPHLGSHEVSRLASSSQTAGEEEFLEAQHEQPVPKPSDSAVLAGID